MCEAAPIQGFDTYVTGTSNYEDNADSDIVLMTAGVARKTVMSRDDLVQINQMVILVIGKRKENYSPNAMVIILTNPVDAMTYTVHKATGFPKK